MPALDVVRNDFQVGHPLVRKARLNPMALPLTETYKTSKQYKSRTEQGCEQRACRVQNPSAGWDA